MKKALVILALIILAQGTCLAATPWKLIRDTYTVREGDTIVSIAEAYIKKNTYGPRGLDEFVEGIIDLNNLKDTKVHTGQKLRINYWVKREKK